MNVRVRYAPSPTGLQHIGSLRTALFNYFFAKSRGGECILRIEDTDRSRYDARSIEDIFSTYAWLGIDFDDGLSNPILQSERASIYAEEAEKLRNSGWAYKCFCSPERIETLRNDQQRRGLPQGYDGHCRALSDEQLKAKEGQAHVLRFRVPDEYRQADPLQRSSRDSRSTSQGQGGIVFHDEVLGSVQTADIVSDPVLLKSDGMPTYHLASVVDDHYMRISHVIRAQEWLSSAGLHILLYKAFGWEAPKFLHLPVVLGSDGKKLSKRHGAMSIAEFRDAGYLPEALLNYVVSLGWSLGDREIFSKLDLEAKFSQGNIHKSPAVFDFKKLQWFNAHYIRQAKSERLIELCRPFLSPRFPQFTSDSPVGSDRDTAQNQTNRYKAEEQHKLLQEAMPIAQERMKLLSEIPEILGFLFVEPEFLSPSDLLPKKQSADEVRQTLNRIRGSFDEIARAAESQNEEGFHGIFEAITSELGLGFAQVMMPLRLALTASRSSPPLIDSIRLLGKEISLQRIDAAIDLLSEQE